MIRAEDLDQVDFTDPTTVRLISTAYIDEPAIAPLADDEGDLAILEEIEGLTSARRTVTLPVPGCLDPAELLTAAAGHGWTYKRHILLHAGDRQQVQRTGTRCMVRKLRRQRDQDRAG